MLNRSAADKQKILEQYAYVAWHLGGLSLNDWFSLDDEERAILAGAVAGRVDEYNRLFEG